ncbi:DUF751 family protein [Microcoleus sp. FACHB-831]|uniref:DUF751 family protein n=1 Tax=Microcoleus sp. FACHB-831 TaxID=2692827 RepID=UPI0016862591|nr:DUF751 family protein [Microcoleus sp. FACHB-831]MBD1919835.1 DUF751 family protein [Microcoleus sp. FACHB-831]
MFDGFWTNVSRYFSYFISITLGIFLYSFERVQNFFKRPTTAIATVGFLLAAITFVALTLRAMLGLSPV